MSISIVTVTYNSSEKIIPLLNTIDMQTGIDKLEIIIVDNNSPDVKKLKEILSKYTFNNKKYSLVTKYRKKILVLVVATIMGLLSRSIKILFF